MSINMVNHFLFIIYVLNEEPAWAVLHRNTDKSDNRNGTNLNLQK